MIEGIASPPSWIAAAAATLAAIGFGILAWRLYQWDPAPEPHVEKARLGHGTSAGIGGWLILPAIGLPLSILRMGAEMAQLMPSYTTQTWFTLTDPLGSNYHALAAPMLIFELVANIGLIVFGLAALVLFFQRRSSLPRVYIAYAISACLVLLVDNLLAAQVPAAAAAVAAQEWPATLRNLLVATIWAAYFLSSGRVRATFVERRQAPAASGSMPAPAASGL